MSDDHDLRIDAALGAMKSIGPRPLIAYLAKPGPDFDEAPRTAVERMLGRILSPDPNTPAYGRFADLLRGWDNEKSAQWTGGTPRNTPERRLQIHLKLVANENLRARIDERIPFYPIDEPVVIAEEHEDWYRGNSGPRSYYWQTYTNYLRTIKGWRPESLLSLENSTNSIVECLTNPVSPKAYSSRGIVVGYVQSGKTANFAGVIARAADAGYRLIIVLAGTWNILRNQTQRRLDKELLGKELLRNDDDYRHDPPDDWDEFLEHGIDLVQSDNYVWERLTRHDIDYKRLRQAIDTLEFLKRDKSRPLYDPANLHHLPAKLLVVKKNSSILEKLIKDLRLLTTKVDHLPTLVIDDESDQAGLNTLDPKTNPADKERTKTNLRIVDLLRIFPRAQYVGYTATPYANAFVDPDDPKDLYPKDFFISLEKPSDYMGASDFFDPGMDYLDLDPEDFSQREIAFIRRVESRPGSDDKDLKSALRSYVIAGALKLYRKASDPGKYRFRHHTMLIHTDHTKAGQGAMKTRIAELWQQCGFNCPGGLADLERLFECDFRRVWENQGAADPFPKRFGDLRRHFQEALGRIEEGEHFLVLNSARDSSRPPDFGKEEVWKVIIGGNKLSRGYTVEGLTTSFYRRVTGSADTLMQMGRWFGFRQGYRDLVRVFLGVNDGPKGNSDLVAQFKEVCRMEQRFRADILRYAKSPDGKRITPKQIPPLVSIAGQLPPTSRNKMFNAVIAERNYGGRWSAPTRVASGMGAAANRELVKKLLAKAKKLGRKTLGGKASSGLQLSMDTFVFESKSGMFTDFLRDFRWLEREYEGEERPADIGLQIEFLEKQNHGISSWLVLLPQRKTSFTTPMQLDGVGEFSTKERSQKESGAFKVFGEGAHRCIAEYLAEIPPDPDSLHLSKPGKQTESLKNKKRGIVLIYPVATTKKGVILIGYEILYPNNNLGFDTNLTVLRKGTEITVASGRGG